MARIASLSSTDWHARFTQQARWTGELRNYLFQKTGLASARRILEVGCGTGAVLAEIRSSATIHGLDIDFARLSQASVHVPQALLTCADAHCLPYPAQTFDLTFCHFLLLWVSDPVLVLREMGRVTRPGGAALAMAEPDYSGRIDHPEELAQLGQWQAESLCRQGADPDLGKKLAALFCSAGIQIVETGALQSRGTAPLEPDEWESEWAMIESDLAGMLADKEIQRLKLLDREALIRRERVMYVPTFYAWGQPYIPL